MGQSTINGGLMGKSSIHVGLSIARFNYQRVSTRMVRKRF